MASSHYMRFAVRTLIVVGITILLVALALALWAVADVLLLAFFGVLVATLLHAAATPLRRWANLRGGWSVALVAAVLAVVAATAISAMAAEAVQQFDSLVTTLANAWDVLIDELGQYRWGQTVIDSSSENGLPSASAIAGQLGVALTTTLHAFGYIIVVLFTAFYVALEPDIYRRGILHLLPRQCRDRAAEVLDVLANTLRWWLSGRLLNMAIVGVLIALGLWMLGVPFVLPLALIAFAADFVPYLGPIASAIPAMLIAATSDSRPSAALYVAVLYMAVQTAESYLIQPLIQRRAVEMPPALLIAAQLACGLLFGLLGVLVATPLVVVATVLVKMLYVEDTLGDMSVSVKGETARNGRR